jgi:hypothetical protein
MPAALPWLGLARGGGADNQLRDDAFPDPLGSAVSHGYSMSDMNFKHLDTRIGQGAGDVDNVVIPECFDMG